MEETSSHPHTRSEKETGIARQRGRFLRIIGNTLSNGLDCILESGWKAVSRSPEEQEEEGEEEEEEKAKRRGGEWRGGG